MENCPLLFRSVSFAYDSSETLFDCLDLSFPAGWTGVIGANGSGKTTLLLLSTGGLPAVRGRVLSPGETLYCPQRTDDPPPLLPLLLDARDGAACEIKGLLGVRPDWMSRWATLSHGERKRAQIAAALWQAPAVLAIDEPTNHIDAHARSFLIKALRSYRGIGLLVSHDRELLDQLCARCLFLGPPRIVLRPGGYTRGLEEGEKEQRYLETRRARAVSRIKHLDREAGEKQREASLTRKRLSKKGIAPKDHDAKSRIDAARLTGKDAVSGKIVRNLEQKKDRARQEAQALSGKKRYDLGLWFQSAPARRDVLFSVPAGLIPLGGERGLSIPDLVMYPRDRIGIAGPNGSGKSTLVRHILDRVSVQKSEVIYLAQEINIEESRSVLYELHGLCAHDLGMAMTVVNLLGSDPERILQSEGLSPGEVRKTLLAVGISRVPRLIVMDEPTNHLDLPSIECLSEALSECACGLLLVSHDERFLKKLTDIRWEAEEDAERNPRLHIY